MTAVNAPEQQAPALTWSLNYSVGDKTIDEQHFKMFEIYNNLASAFNECLGQNAIRDTLDELIGYTLIHFKDEERIMAKYDFDELEHHIVQHKMLLGKVGDFVNKLEYGDSILTYELLKFIENWLTSHILEEDMNFKTFLMNR